MTSVGELARETGVSRQLLRHYDRLGLLRPSRSASRYRLYSEEDRARLELIRALRELDIDLRTIARMLRGAADWRSVAELHLRALAHQARVTRRRAAVLRASLRDDASLDVPRLDRLQRLARLDRAEKTRFVSDELANRLDGTTPSPLRQAIAAAAHVELPDDPTSEQLDAWLELAELVSDPKFLAHYRGRPAQRATAARTRQAIERVQRDVLAAIRRGVEPHHPEARPLVKRWVRATSRGSKRRSDRQCAIELLRVVDSGRHDPERRFWELLGALKPELRSHPSYAISPWIMRGVRAWLAE
jgi:DNA-binding transcriptional MerR regulator